MTIARFSNAARARRSYSDFSVLPTDQPANTTPGHGSTRPVFHYSLPMVPLTG